MSETTSFQEQSKTSPEIVARFPDLHPAFDRQAAVPDANILGASCSRACPVQVLCEGACVMHRYNKKPIEIGRLQRFAMDALHESGAPLPFTPGKDTGKTVALIGGG